MCEPDAVPGNMCERDVAVDSKCEPVQGTLEHSWVQDILVFGKDYCCNNLVQVLDNSLVLVLDSNLVLVLVHSKHLQQVLERSSLKLAR